MSLRHSGEEESALADLSWGLLFVFLTLTIILIAESGNGPQDCLKNAQAVEDCICKATEWCSMPEPEEPDPPPPEDEPLPPCGSVHQELLDEFRGDLPVWGAALVVVIPRVPPFAQRIFLGVSLIAFAVLVGLHFRAKRRWRAEQAATSEPDPTDE